MERILVVDDSSFDLRHVMGLLKKRDRWIVDSAANGNEALSLLERQRFHVILSDLIMPEANGLELLAAVRRRFPETPVVIMTSRGSEEIAVQALHEGAANYLCKKHLARDLVRVLDCVLTASSTERANGRLLRHLAHGELAFALPNDSEMVFVATRFLQETVDHLQILDRDEWTRLGIVLEEALTNAMVHGNLEVGTGVTDRDDSEHERLISARRRTPPFSERRIFVTATFQQDEVRFVIRDEGPGFDTASIENAFAPENLTRENGRGLFLIHHFMDEAVFNAKGNELTLVKRRRSPDPHAAEQCESPLPATATA